MASICRVTPSVEHLGQNNIQLSPSSTHIAYIGSSATKLFVSELSSNKIVHIFPCVDRIDKVEWSPNSKLLFCAMFSRCTIQIFHLEDKEWTCRINEGMAGMIHARWCPDSLHILIESDFGIQISIWSLTDSSSYLFKYPKQAPSSSSRGGPSLSAFSSCESFMVLGHRIELQDYIGLYSTDPWTELTKFKCRSNDLAQLSFVPESTNIIAVDSILHYRVTIYSPSGAVLSLFEPYQNALGPRCLSFHQSNVAKDSYSNESNSPEVTAISASSSSRSKVGLFAIGSYDGKVRILSSKSWQLAFVLPLIHPRDVKAADPSLRADVKTCVEMEQGKVAGIGGNNLNNSVFETDLWGSTTFQDCDSSSILNQSVNLNSTLATVNSYVFKNLKTLPRIHADLRVTSLPHMGVNWLAFAPNDATVLAARDEAHPRCLWIWDALHASLLAVLVQLLPIQCAAWRPSASSAEPILAFCTGTERIYFWSSGSGPSFVSLGPYNLANGLRLFFLGGCAYSRYGRHVVKLDG